MNIKYSNGTRHFEIVKSEDSPNHGQRSDRVFAVRIEDVLHYYEYDIGDQPNDQRRRHLCNFVQDHIPVTRGSGETPRIDERRLKRHKSDRQGYSQRIVCHTTRYW